MDELNNGISSTIFLAAGGTGGHIFPAIALGEELAGRGHKVILVTDRRTEKYLGSNNKITYEFIPVKSPYGSFKNKLIGSLSLIKSYFNAGKLLKKYNASAVIGFGGYPSFPTLYAAMHKKIPTIIHEQNSVLGRANKMLAAKVNVIATGFEAIKGADKNISSKFIYTGNPTRPAINEVRNHPYPDFTDSSKLNILVTGGSQGASVFAKIVPQAIKLLPDEFRSRIRISQQAREGEIESVRSVYNELGVEADISAFFNDMPRRISECHLVICRSGASSLAEISVAGRPAVMVPLPSAKDDHQTANAMNYEKSGAGWIINESSFTAENLKILISELFRNPGKLISAAGNARSSAMLDADKKLADIIESMINNKN